MGAGGALIVHPIYQSAFDALKAALDADDLLVGRSTLARLEGRLAADVETLPTMKEAQKVEDGSADLILTGQHPSKEHAEAALRMARNFGRVFEGRVRMESLELMLALERVAGAETCRATLIATSTWHAPLVLKPGPATLEVARVSLEPRTGVERRDHQSSHMESDVTFEIPARGTRRFDLAEIPIEVPVGAIATRMVADIEFIGGTIDQEGESFPARFIEIEAAERTDLASWVPATLVEPSELVRLWQRGNTTLAALIERTVRVAPSRYEETLDRLGLAAETLPVNSFHAIVPSLRWFTRANRFGRDEGAWRLWLLGRLDDRRADGTLIE